MRIFFIFDVIDFGIIIQKMTLFLTANGRNDFIVLNNVKIRNKNNSICYNLLLKLVYWKRIINKNSHG